MDELVKEILNRHNSNIAMIVFHFLTECVDAVKEQGTNNVVLSTKKFGYLTCEDVAYLAQDRELVEFVETDTIRVTYQGFECVELFKAEILNKIAKEVNNNAKN